MKIDNFSNYEIYPNEGKIWSYKSNKFIGNKTPTGYYNCTLRADDGSLWNTSVHRAIWVAVNGQIPSDMQINHIDENKDNNSISNLNLMTCKENTNYGSRNERAAKAISKSNTNNPNRSKAVGAYRNGELVITFPSTAEAGRNGFDHSCVAKCCRGVKNYNTYKGYTWQYLN